MRTLAIVAAGFLAAAVFASPAFAKNYGVFVDGSYSSGKKDSDMDKLIDKRLRRAQEIMAARDPQSERTPVGSKADLMTTLGGIMCGEGDSITVVLMGHGKKNEFKFSKAKGAERTLSATDLANMLEAAAKDCRCKIHVVIFSCYSGSFLDELLAKQHIVSVWASSGEDEKSWSNAYWDENRTFVDDGDWMKGFLDDWANAPASTDIGDDLEAGADSAEEDMPITQWDKQTPVGWRKGDHTVRAHIEEAPSGNMVKVHYWEPKFLRSNTRDLDLTGVTFPPGLKACDWVTFTGTFTDPSTAPTTSGPITGSTPPTIDIVAHVQGAGTKNGRSFLVVHTLRPRRSYCKKQRLIVDPTKVDPRVQVCTFIEETVTVTDPDERMSTGGDVEPGSPTFRVKVHVRGGRNHERGTFGAHVLEPSFLKCRNWNIQLPTAERGRLREIRTCNNVFVDVELSSTAATDIPGSNLTRIRKTSKSFGPTNDAAANSPQALDFYLERDEEPFEPREITPTAAVTNVGEVPIDGMVTAVIGLAEEAELLREWLLSGGAPPFILWQDQQPVLVLEPGDTANVELLPWQLPLPGGDFWFGFRIESPGDEVSDNDLGELFFTLDPEIPLPAPLVGPSFGR